MNTTSGTIYLQRHGYRLDIFDKANNTTHWKNSPRRKQHFNDMPISDINEIAIQSNAPLIKAVDVIYCSPALRCIQTAQILQKSLGIPIIIEYGLMEVALQQVSKLNQNFIYHEMSYPIEIDGIRYEKNIDEPMQPDNIAKSHPGVNPYSSLYNPDDIPFVMSDVEWGNRMVVLLEYFRAKHNNILIVAHSGLLENVAPYLANRSIFGLSNYVSGDDRTGALAICQGKGVSVYQNGELTYRNIL
jgi:broad specificity phosphatase PhoE